VNDIVAEIDFYLSRLFPIVRSLTGEGNRTTLRILQEIAPISIKEYPSRKKVYDWVVPEEWNINDGWIRNSEGEKIVDFQKSNLHVVSYSMPIHKTLSYCELIEHIHYRKDVPSAIPYRTSYYEDNWGFCISYKDFKKYFNKQETYEVYIDSEKKKGSLTCGEILLNGTSKQEYLISTYICHPSLANDNLTGPILTAFLSRELLDRNLNYSYRILFAPETIGAITYCAYNESDMKKIDCGLVITTCGGPGPFGYKQSWDKHHSINQIITKTFESRDIEYREYPFDINGSDERQFSSQGFRINVASVTKDKYYEYEEYHTSLDNLQFVKAEYIYQSLMIYLEIIGELDKNIVFENMNPNCEVMLSRHNLYPAIGGYQNPIIHKNNERDIVLWLLFLCDGKMNLFEIAQHINVSLEVLYNTAIELEAKGIIRRI